MANVESIMQAVTTYGLAIVMCVFLCWLIYKISLNHKEELKTITEAHQAQLKELTETYNKKVDGFTNAINNNTKVMEKVLNVVLSQGSPKEGDQ